jgi:hemin uptake protein HemP
LVFRLGDGNVNPHATKLHGIQHEVHENVISFPQSSRTVESKILFLPQDKPLIDKDPLHFRK